MAVSAPLHAQDDINFNPNITPDDFGKFSRVIAQGIYPDPVQPARATGFLGFDVGVALTGVKVDTNAQYWKNAFDNNSFETNGYVGVPRLVVSKGLSAATISGSYAKITNSGIKTYGGSIDVPVIRGTLVSPELAARVTYGTISGIDVYKLKTYGAELYLSKGFGPLMPYGAIGRQWSDANGHVDPSRLPAGSPPISFTNKSSFNRYTAGLRISLLLPKIVVEATKGEVMSYSAKISIGL